jgi:GTP-binding protein
VTAHIKESDFVLGAEQASGLPPVSLPEIAVVGRSNVGKSTFINRITGRTKLARTSSTPGQTRQLNLFRLRLELPERPERRLHLVDLPGFGYAKRSHKDREALQRLIVDYLTTREGVLAVALLNDCRRDPTRDDLAIRDLAFDAGAHLFVVVTKADKLGKNDLRKRLAAVAEGYSLEPSDLIVSGEKFDVTPFWERVEAVLESSLEASGPGESD